jgi:hypothetical protein
MLSLELPDVREFVVVNRYRETYVSVADHVKIRELDRYNCSFVARQINMIKPLTRQDKIVNDE